MTSQMLPNIYITEKQRGRDVTHQRRQLILAAGLENFAFPGSSLFFRFQATMCSGI